MKRIDQENWRMEGYPRFMDGYPRCAVCKRPVDHIVIAPDPVRCYTDIVIHCHGAVEKLSISYKDIVDATSINIGGEAFSCFELEGGS